MKDKISKDSWLYSSLQYDLFYVLLVLFPAFLGFTIATVISLILTINKDSPPIVCIVLAVISGILLLALVVLSITEFFILPAIWSKTRRIKQQKNKKGR